MPKKLKKPIQPIASEDSEDNKEEFKELAKEIAKELLEEDLLEEEFEPPTDFENPIDLIEGVNAKKCTGKVCCGELKAYKYFQPIKRPCKYSPNCKECINKQKRGYDHKIDTEGVKTCKICKEEKHVTLFGLDKKEVGGRYRKCSKCVSEYNAKCNAKRRAEKKQNKD